MVEMLEAKNAIANATENSLILFDEIGRGTSTYDGMALAQAMVEYIHDKIRAKTLFSTHYHELTILDQKLPKLKNVHVSAIEKNGHVVFLHKIQDGPTDKSYGIHVAKLADLPKELIERAEEILNELENGSQTSQGEKVIPTLDKDPLPEKGLDDKRGETSAKPAQLSLFDEPEVYEERAISSKEKKVLKEILSINLLEMTPLDAINTLYQLQKKLRK